MIKWTKVTWYSWYGTIFLFIAVLPVLSFYIGTQFEATRQVLLMQGGDSELPPSFPQLKKATTTVSVHSEAVLNTVPNTVWNSGRDLWAVNTGSEGILFSFKNEPEGTSLLRLSHSGSVSGPWVIDKNISYTSSFTGPIIDTRFATTQSLYYKLEAISGSDILLKSWSPVLVKKVSAQ